jgi:hypothetical protein
MDACGPYCYEGIQGTTNSSGMVPRRFKFLYLLRRQTIRCAADNSYAFLFLLSQKVAADLS